MKCLACDEILNDVEATRKTSSGMFLDLCDPCYEEMKDLLTVVPRDYLEVDDDRNGD